MKNTFLRIVAFVALALLIGGVIAIISLVAKGEESTFKFHYDATTRPVLTELGHHLETNVITASNETGCRTCFESNKNLSQGPFVVPLLIGWMWVSGDTFLATAMARCSPTTS